MRTVRLLVALALLGCGAPAAPSGSADAGTVEVAEPPPPPTPSAAPEVARPRPAPIAARAGDRVTIPAGVLHVGSQPGTPERRPSVEADLVGLDVPAVDIDRLPYPNDPARPAQLAATRAEASALCAAEGRRLCEELEWERACRGDGLLPFATGESIDLEACTADPSACPSSVGVMDLGVRAPEWTASDAEARLARLERTAVVRGGRPDSSASSHRCGTRQVVDPAGADRGLAFRCCGGDAPDLAYPDVGLRRMFSDLEVDRDRWRTILASVPELAAYAADFEPYGEPEALRALGLGGATEADMQWELTRGPFSWSPTTGEELWVVAGHGGGATVIAALYPLPDGTFQHAASFFVREEEPVPAAILRTRTARGELLWSTCWGCAGESGVIRFGEDATVVVAQQ